MKTEAVRIAFTRELLRLAQSDSSIFAVVTDSRGSAALSDFAAALPERIIECGIAEQNAIGIAAGLVSCGLRPFAFGPASFYTTRAAEQIKVDIGYSGMNVKVIGVSGGVSYGALGATHHAIHDIALLRAIPGIEIYLPSDGSQAASLARHLAASDKPAYVRMGRGAVPSIYEENAPFVPGRANRLRMGVDCALIACGEMVFPALVAAKLLSSRGVEASVYDMHTLRPLDEDAIVEAARTRLVVTVEEHSVHGGLGAAVAEVLSQKLPTRMRILGLPDETLYSGTSTEVFSHYGLTPEGIAGKVREAL